MRVIADRYDGSRHRYAIYVALHSRLVGVVSLVVLFSRRIEMVVADSLSPGRAVRDARQLQAAVLGGESAGNWGVFCRSDPRWVPVRFT